MRRGWNMNTKHVHFFRGRENSSLKDLTLKEMFVLPPTLLWNFSTVRTSPTSSNRIYMHLTLPDFPLPMNILRL
jgi:hypothetical protein